MQALLASVSTTAAPPQSLHAGDFPGILAEASALSRRCAAGAAEAVAALKAALADCDPAEIAAQTTVDTPLVINSLLAAAQGIPVAEVWPCICPPALAM